MSSGTYGFDSRPQYHFFSTSSEQLVYWLSVAKSKLVCHWCATMFARGRFWTRLDFKTAFNKACKIAGLEDLHFHDLRHTAITRMLETLDRSEVMKISGHTQERTFMRYVNPNMASIADRLDRRKAVGL